MCEDFEYVAIAGTGKHGTRWTRGKNGVEVLNKLIKIAHKHKTKVHGLGYTPMKTIKKVR